MALLMAFLASAVTLLCEILRSASLEKSVSELMRRADFRDSSSRTSSIFFNKVSQSPCKVKGKNIVYAIILQRFKEISLLMFWFHSVIKWNIKIAAKTIQLDRIWDLNSTQYNNSKMTTIEFLELAKTNMCCVHILKYQTKYQTE